ncbi:MAG: hypothetical protein IAE78_16820 [Myxococcus sp.]|nr:hypothetical protein [Myxococcus sp.]
MTRRLLALAFVLTLTPGVARAAACCMSATSFGVGRLLVWEDFATGVTLGHTRVVGQWDPSGTLRLLGSDFSDGISRVEPWAIVRLAERVQVQARLPLLLNDRAAGSLAQTAGGLGDVGAAVRVEAIMLGEYDRLPSLGFTVGALLPTGRRAEQTLGPLGAGVTGRGAWGASFALESEYTWLPWFLRLDAGVTLFAPFKRTDTQAVQGFGPVVQAALSSGRELVADKLVLAVSAQVEFEGALRMDGEVQPASSGFVPSLVTSLSWRPAPHWTLVTSVNTSVWPSGVAFNRDARVGLVIGGRYGHF